MSVRDTLLRQHRWQLEERQQFLAGLEALAERLRGDARRLDLEIGDSKLAGGYSSADGVDYPPLLRALVERQRRLDRSIIEVEARIGEARGLVGAAMQEVERSAAALRTQPERIPGRVGRRARRGRPHLVHGSSRQRGS